MFDDQLLRRCRTVVRCGRLPAEIARTRLTAGHGIRSCWCRLWVSELPADPLGVDSSLDGLADRSGYRVRYGRQNPNGGLGVAAATVALGFINSVPIR